jgi:predicted ATP-grasp superfamily ATP-dependent carboligase
MGAPVYTIIEDPFAPMAASRYLTGAFVWDTRDLVKSEILNGLANVGRRLNHPTLLIPTDDHAAVLIAEEAITLQEWFIFPEVKPNLPRSLANKQLLHALCKQLGVPCPRAAFPTSMADVYELSEEVTFPVVVKRTCSWLKPNVRTTIVRSPTELVAIYRHAESTQIPNLFIQEYIAAGEDWFFHGYCNKQSNCVAAFTGRKLRGYPVTGGFTTLGQSVRNEALSQQTESLLEGISYSGIMDIDYRFDRCDEQYKLLDFNPRVGAQFRLFEDSVGNDVIRALYRDVMGEQVCRTPQTEGRIFIVEPHDCLASLQGLRSGELTMRAWWRSYQGLLEFAWFNWNDPVPFLMVWIRLLLRGASKLLHAMHNVLRSGIDSAKVPACPD